MDVRRMHPRQGAEYACRQGSIRSQALGYTREKAFLSVIFSLRLRKEK
jgi:hypothetical protein